MGELAATYLRRGSTAALGVAGLLAICGAYLSGGFVAPGKWDAGSAPAAQRAAAKPGAAPAPAIPPQTFKQLTPQQAALLNAAVPVSQSPNPAAAPFILKAVNPADGARAENCLAMAVYYEAANQGADGEAAVAQVVLNRMRNPAFPKTVCGVVFQGSNLPTGCQFTFTCDGSLARTPSVAGWRDALYVARRALSGYVMRDVGEATHYHTIWVVPYWQTTVLKVAQLGAHVFYRWSGSMGQPAAFNGAYAGMEYLPPLPTGLEKQVQAPAPAEPVVLASASAAAFAEKPAGPAVAAAAPPVVAQKDELSASISVPTSQINQGYFGGRPDGGAHHLPL
jgi:spore germination cell wall hydrolase CwlJ-like protein